MARACSPGAGTGPAPLRVVVLISGAGSNLAALMAAQADSGYRIVGVISNRAEAWGLERARAAGIPAEVLNHRDFPERDAYDRALAACLDRYRPGLVVLAGFMRILTPGFVDRYAGRMLNIHPSLLPRYRGLHTHRRVLEAGDLVHGASVHFVTAELDGGPVVIQAQVPVLPDDDPDTLASRVLAQEHRIYPQAVAWFAAGRLRLGDDGQALLDGVPLRTPRRLEAGETGLVSQGEPPATLA